MRTLIGFWLICEVIIVITTVLIGSEALDAKEIIRLILLLSILFAVICVGSYLLAEGV